MASQEGWTSKTILMMKVAKCTSMQMDSSYYQETERDSNKYLMLYVYEYVPTVELVNKAVLEVPNSHWIRRLLLFKNDGVVSN